jgi:hypothetical protein
MQPLIEELK